MIGNLLCKILWILWRNRISETYAVKFIVFLVFEGVKFEKFEYR